MKYTQRMKTNGELAMRAASEMAAAFYEETDPLDVYEYEIDIEDEDGEIVDEEKRYAYKFGGCEMVEGLTFEELEEEFEAYAKEIQDSYEEMVKEVEESNGTK